jgi:hypothetical protein
MMKYIQIDIYGNCGSYFKNSKPIPCQNNEFYNECFTNLIDSYKFYLAFENSLCDDYVSEKFWKFYTSSMIFKTNIVPVVKGAKRSQYNRLVNNEHMLIQAEDYKSAESLANHLVYLNMNQTAYLDYFKWKLNLYDQFTNSSQNSLNDRIQQPLIQSDVQAPFCYLCSMLHNKTFINSRTNPSWKLSEWFSVKESCWDADEQRQLFYRLAQLAGFCF